MFLLLSLTTALAQTTTDCIATDDSGLRYTSWRYAGGPYPAPGMQVGRETWTLGETTLFVHIAHSEAPSTTQGALTWTWAHHTPAPTPVPAHGTYTTHVTLTVPDGAPPNPLVPTEPVPMTCTAHLAPPMP